MSDQDNGFLRRNWVNLCFAILMLVIIAGMGYLISTAPNQTKREAALEAVILTAASVVGSALVTKIYAGQTYS